MDDRSLTLGRLHDEGGGFPPATVDLFERILGPDWRNISSDAWQDVTLGQYVDALSPEHAPLMAAQYEHRFGPTWRDKTTVDASEDHSSAMAEHEQVQAEREERLSVVERLEAKMTAAGRPLDDAMVGELIRELYGDKPSKASTDLVLELVVQMRPPK